MFLNKGIKKLSDEVLMQRFIKQGDKAAFEVLYQRQFLSLSKYISWLLADADKGKDIAQDIFVKLYQKPELFDTSKSFKAWLFSVAKNQYKNEIRNEMVRSNQLKSFMTTINVSFEEHPLNTERLQLVKKAVEGLSEQHKDVFILKYSNNLTLKEISEVCQCSVGTVKSRLFYALKCLKEKVELIKIEE